MSNVLLYKANSRGNGNHGWLESHHTFSFAGYFNPNRMNFGVLRVLNDDVIHGGSGFPTHPHDNMEIITIILEGALEHNDSMGHTEQLKKGEVQVMSAGTGLKHSEYNASHSELLNLFQIWIFPDKQNVLPRYAQQTYDVSKTKNTFFEIVTPYDGINPLWIQQQAWLSLGDFETEQITEYSIKQKGNGFFAMVVNGQCEIAGQILNDRDAIGIWDIHSGLQSVSIAITKPDTRILLIDVPME
jgi:redox-sensitive bicupin YhaK (pirin superfamily)